MNAPVFVGVSGGTDSAVSALLLKQQGFAVTAVHLLLTTDAPSARVESLCRTLDIPLVVVDARQDFHEKVVTPFLETYSLGLTPNPCAWCNPGVKFRLLALQRAGEGMVATGHYVQARRSCQGFELHRGVDGNKDQSYFLALTPASLLCRSVFPLGNMTKVRVKDIARQAGLPIGSSESQDACFLEGRGLADYMARAFPHKVVQGDFVHEDGRVIGPHGGIHRYTVGQNKGLGLGGETGKLYVKHLDPMTGAVTVAPRESLFSSTVSACGCNWLGSAPLPGQAVGIKTRYRQPPVPGHVAAMQGDAITVTADEPLWATAPGQVLALYEETRLLGGGIITR